MISIPARLVLCLYIGFLVFYFIPWNLRNIEKSDQLEMELKANFGQVNALDEMEITLSQLFSFVCVIISLLSAAKCGYVALAPSRFTSDVCLYPVAVLASIVVSVLTHETFPQSVLFTSGSWTMLIQPILAIARGFLLHRVLFSHRPAVKSVGSEDVKKEASHPPLSTFAFTVQVLAKLWFFAYWTCYVVLGCFFYNEIVKYVVEEHIDVKTFMTFILV